jgi:hypothetical protein
VSERGPLTPLIGALRDLTRWLDSQEVPHAIIGGVAASLLATPRLTQDVDAVVLLESERWESFLASGGAFGFQPRQADALDFARKVRVLLLRHEPSGIAADISFGTLPFEREAVERARLQQAAPNLWLRLPSPEDLIIMKAVAHRGRDLVDIEALIQAHPRLDHARILRWVEEFASLLEMPEILEDLKALLVKNPRKGTP